MIFNSIGTVIKESNVVADTITGVYSFSLSKPSANIEVMAAAGIVVMIFTEFIALEITLNIFQNCRTNGIQFF